ncbi:MAG: hypothetical protein ABI760_10855 [Ferruginibacter sp.]
MNRTTVIQLKAAFLLLIFGLNTIVGFACAMGIEMGFNTSHKRGETSEGTVHVHANGANHQHHDEANKDHPDNVSEVSVHVQVNGEKPLPHNHSNGHHCEKKDAADKGDCCNNKVIKVLQSDKSVRQFNTIANPVFFTVFVSSYYNIALLFPSQVTASIKYFVRCYHPPISDNRIAIRSFQI